MATDLTGIDLTQTKFLSIDKRGFLYQPNLVRWRHKYRSPRESLKINQELGQTYFDVANLYKKCTELETELNENLSQLSGGGEIDSVNVTLPGLNELTRLVDDIQTRIRNIG